MTDPHDEMLPPTYNPPVEDHEFHDDLDDGLTLMVVVACIAAVVAMLSLAALFLWVAP